MEGGTHGTEDEDASEILRGDPQLAPPGATSPQNSPTHLSRHQFQIFPQNNSTIMSNMQDNQMLVIGGGDNNFSNGDIAGNNAMNAVLGCQVSNQQNSNILDLQTIATCLGLSSTFELQSILSQLGLTLAVSGGQGLDLQAAINCLEMSTNAAALAAQSGVDLNGSLGLTNSNEIEIQTALNGFNIVQENDNLNNQHHQINQEEDNKMYLQSSSVTQPFEIHSAINGFTLTTGPNGIEIQNQIDLNQVQAIMDLPTAVQTLGLTAGVSATELQTALANIGFVQGSIGIVTGVNSLNTPIVQQQQLQQPPAYNTVVQKRKKYRLRLCVDTNALRSWIVH